MKDDLDFYKMSQACEILQGHHDFSSFRKSSDDSNPVRTLRVMKVLRDRGDFLSWTHQLDLDNIQNEIVENGIQSDFPGIESSLDVLSGLKTGIDDTSPKQYIVVASAQSFMTHQVRKMVSGVVEVGRGRMTVEELKSVLESKSPANCPSMAPSHGLFLSKVKYPAYQVLDSSG